MRKIKEVLRLKWANGLSDRKIARSCGIGRPTVKKYLLRAEQAGLSWPIPEEWDDARLEQCLFPEPSKDAVLERGLPDWAAVHQEMTSVFPLKNATTKNLDKHTCYRGVTRLFHFF